MKRFISTLVLGLLLTSCTVGIVNVETLTEVPSVTPTSAPATADVKSSPTLSPSPLNTPMPAETGRIELVGRFLSDATDILVQGGWAYISDGELLTIMDVSAPIHPVITSQIDIGMHIAQVVGDYAYAIGIGNCEQPNRGCQVMLRILDVSDPSAPVLVSTFPWDQRDTMPWIAKIAVVEDAVYIADPGMGLLILDISDPFTPVEVMRQEGHFWDVATVGDYAYLVAFSDDWTRASYDMLDISTPTVPGKVGGYDITDYADGDKTRVIVENNHAYLIAQKRRLDIVDISDPTIIHQVGSYDIPQDAQGQGYIVNVTIADGYAYVESAYGSAGHVLWIVAISDPTFPHQVGAYNIPRDAQGMGYIAHLLVADDYVYLESVHSSGHVLRVVDVSNPAAPREVGAYDLGPATDLAVVYDVIYVTFRDTDQTGATGDDGGLLILRYTGSE